MIEVKLLKDFNIITETLERIGIVNKIKKEITPSCYLIQKNDKYYIAHFKTLLKMQMHTDSHIPMIDYVRRNAIITMMRNWRLIDIMEIGIYQSHLQEKIFVLAYDQKMDYKINHKFNIKKYQKNILNDHMLTIDDLPNLQY